MATNIERDLKQISDRISELNTKISEVMSNMTKGGSNFTDLTRKLVEYQRALAEAVREQRKLQESLAQIKPLAPQKPVVTNQGAGSGTGLALDKIKKELNEFDQARSKILAKMKELQSLGQKDIKTGKIVFPAGTEERIAKVQNLLDKLNKTEAEFVQKSTGGRATVVAPGVFQEGNTVYAPGGHPDFKGEPLDPIINSFRQALGSSQSFAKNIERLEKAALKGATEFEKEVQRLAKTVKSPETKKMESFQKEQALVERAGERLAAQLKVKRLKDEERLAKKEEELAQKRQEALQNELRKVEQAGGQVSARLMMRQMKADEKAAKAAEEEARLRELRTKVLSNPRYAQALEQAAKLGLGIQDLREVLDKGGGVQRLQFSNISPSGVTNKAQFYVDKYGRSTPGLSSQFRSFGSDILRDIGQFTKWSIAVAAVYTPIQKLGELLQSMVEVQSHLADATIATNRAFSESGDIFNVAYRSAKQAGEGVLGVVDAYTAAYRAAGRLSDPVSRQVASVKLLDASLILSKLSTLDQATAIDTLSAALLQSEMGLDRGEELLNKWVRVSQVANVSIDSLATGVAVLGDSAEAAGLDIDKLNGLIAVISEQSISGSKEAANTAKALIGAYQSDAAEQALAKFGFALRRSNGEVRQFLDVYQELARARQKGILSEADVSELSTALGGGGSRRAKDVAALINSQERLLAIAKESSLVTSDSTLAQDALEKKLQTVETATTRLSNAFQNLAQTLGNEGGLLDAFTLFINLTTKLVESLTSLFSLVGRSGVSLSVISTAALALSKVPASSVQTMLAMLGNRKDYGTDYLNARLAFAAGNAGVPAPGVIPGGGLISGMVANVLQAGAGYRTAGAYRGGVILGALGVGASAVSNISSGESDRAAANVIGGIIGGAIGATFGPLGIAIGANIGSAIGESFVKNVVDFAPEWQKLFFPDVSKASEAGGEKENPYQEVLKELKNESGTFNILMSQLSTWALRNTPEFALRTAISTFRGLGLVKKDFDTEAYLQQRKGIYAEGILYQLAPEDLKRRIDLLEERRKIRENEVDISTDTKYSGLRDTLQQKAIEERQKLLARLSRGEISSGEFGKSIERLSGFPSIAIRGVEAFGNELDRVSSSINSVEDAYNAFLYLTVNGTKEQSDQLSKYITDIEYLDKILKTFSEEDIGTTIKLSFGDVKIGSREQLEQLKGGIQLEAGTALNTMITQLQLQQTKVPQIVGSTTEPTSKADFNAIEQEARRLQEKFFKDLNLTDEQIQYLASQMEDFAVLVGDAAQNHYETISGIDQRFWQAAQDMLEKAGKLSLNKGIGFQEFDVDRSTLERLAAQSLQLGQVWQDRFNYDFRPEDQIAITQEGIVKPLHADFRILALLLEKIVDQNQKQLDGQYNIPEGATFWVPITAAYYRNKGGNGLDIDSLLERTFQMEGEQLDGSAQKLSQAGDVLMGAGIALGNFSGSLAPALSQIATSVGVALGAKTPISTLNPQGRRLSLPPEMTDTAPGRGYRSSTYGFDTKSSGVSGGVTETSFIEQLKQKLLNLFGVSQSSIGRNMNSGLGGGLIGDNSIKPSRVGLSGQFAQQNAPVQQSKLDIKLESTTNLVVDGRVLASIIKPFLAADLLRTEATQGTITKRYII